MKIEIVLKKAERALASYSETAHLDAQLLLGFLLKKSRLDLLMAHKEMLTLQQVSDFDALIELRRQGIPVAYLTGKKEFWSLELEVNADTLVPRPETELLVETALRLFPSQAALQVADMGTGSGAIALALAMERPEWSITAVDASEGALQIARQNLKRYQFKHVSMLQSHWFDAIAHQRFHLIVSNPPYLAEDDPHLHTAIRHEPHTALVAGEQGLAALHHLIVESVQHLYAQGWLILEHGFQQAQAVRELFQVYRYTAIQTLRDFSGHERVSFARLP